MKNILNVDINYITYGNENGKNVVLLHGWGQNIEMMKPIGDTLKSEYRVTIIDLPGHGKSSEPKDIWQLTDFVECLKQLFKELNINKPILIGHSFGGKIALLYASMYETEKLIVLGSPYKPEITKEKLQTKILKTLKKVPILKNFENFAKKHIGSTDYRNASEVMRKILVSHINLDITENVKKIESPTLIIWGTKDEAVPLKRAYELEKLIKDAGVVTYEGCTHYAYLERLAQTSSVIKTFIREE